MGEILSPERDKISIYFKVSFATSERKSKQGFIEKSREEVFFVQFCC